MLWVPEPLWLNETVFIIGGGLSLKEFDFNLLRNRHVLAINEAFIDVPWADVLFFRDGDWFMRARPDLCMPVFQGILVTTSPQAEQERPNMVMLVTVNTPDMPRARTSGHNAVSLALTMLAKRIVLMGFDFNPEGGNYHDRHTTPGLKYRGGLMESWRKYRDRADRLGYEIINATPGSYIDDFRRMTIEEVLG